MSPAASAATVPAAGAAGPRGLMTQSAPASQSATAPASRRARPGARAGAGPRRDGAAHDVLGVAGDAVEPSRSPGVLPRQAEEVQAGDGGDAAVVRGVAGPVEYPDLRPA